MSAVALLRELRAVVPPEWRERIDAALPPPRSFAAFAATHPVDWRLNNCDLGRCFGVGRMVVGAARRSLRAPAPTWPQRRTKAAERLEAIDRQRVLAMFWKTERKPTGRSDAASLPSRDD